MKLSKKIILAFGAAACVSLVYAGSALTNTENTEAAGEKNALVGTSASYGTTETVIKLAELPMFSHKAHVMGVGLDCDSCHPDIFAKERGVAAAAGDYTMESLEQGKYCGSCHDGDTAFGVTGPESCVTCHGSNMKKPETIVFEKPVQAVIFDHTMHTDEIGLECSDCHNDIFKMKLGSAEALPEEFTMEALYAGKFCGACHDGESAFASDTKCTSCHIGVIGANRLLGKKPDTEAEHSGH
jgi:c(7)-type cytochrome triheme protein